MLAETGLWKLVTDAVGTLFVVVIPCPGVSVSGFNVLVEPLIMLVGGLGSPDIVDTTVAVMVACVRGRAPVIESQRE